MDSRNDRPRLELGDDGPTCRNCLAVIRPVRGIMDPITGRSVRMFECDDCGQRTWDDEG